MKGGGRRGQLKTREPSKSAEMVAFGRAIENSFGEQVRLFSDPFAEHFLPPASRFVCELSHARPIGNAIIAIGNWLIPGGFGFLIGRTCFIDRALRDALKEGIDQLVILGAGYDCRAYRLPQPSPVTTFEVDHPDTQTRKRKVVERLESCSTANVRFVAVDFERESLETEMTKSGFVSGLRNFFIWEGVTQYLRPTSVDATLRYVVDVSRPASQIAFTYVDRGFVRGTKRFAGAGRILRTARRLGEPIQFGVEPRELRSFLDARGLELLDDVVGVGFVDRFFAPRGRRLSSSEYEHAALARVRGEAAG